MLACSAFSIRAAPLWACWGVLGWRRPPVRSQFEPPTLNDVFPRDRSLRPGWGYKEATMPSLRGLHASLMQPQEPSCVLPFPLSKRGPPLHQPGYSSRMRLLSPSHCRHAHHDRHPLTISHGMFCTRGLLARGLSRHGAMPNPYAAVGLDEMIWQAISDALRTAQDTRHDMTTSPTSLRRGGRQAAISAGRRGRLPPPWGEQHAAAP